MYLASGTTGAVVTHNKIYDNIGPAVAVTQTSYWDGTKWASSSGMNNTIRQNSIYGNTGTYNLGIDLGNDGITPNDLLDPDTGPNSFQNYPVITSSMTKCDGTTDTQNVPMFNSTPNTTFTIDYYANPSWDSSSGLPRQGEQWIGSETVTTDANGNATLNIPAGITNPSATATDPNGNTSEFGSINNIKFTDCQNMLQRVVGDSSKDIYLDAAWTGENITATQYSSNSTWDGTKWVYNIQKTDLNVKVSVGGQDIVYTDPLPQGSWAYELNAWGWRSNGHTATPLPEGEYDVYFVGYDVSYQTFTKEFPGGLVVDFTGPTATLVTDSAKDTVSPELNGTVSDTMAKVEVSLTSPDGTVLGPFTARNNGNGTWTLPTGTIQPGLTLGA